MRTHKYLQIGMQQELDLYQFIENSSKPRERKRAMAILMNHDKKSVSQIAQKLKMNPDTVYDWLVYFQKDGLQGIKDKPISGRPKKLRKSNEESIKEVFKKSS